MSDQDYESERESERDPLVPGGKVNKSPAPLTTDEESRIRTMIQKSLGHGYKDVHQDHTFFLVDDFHPTDFNKTTKYPIQRSKFFNLADVTGSAELPTTADLAANLTRPGSPVLVSMDCRRSATKPSLTA